MVTAGLGGMGGAQPLAITMNGGVALVVEVDPARIQRRLDTGYCDMLAEDLDHALKVVEEALAKGEPRSVAVLGNAAEVHPELVRRGIVPDLVTDQTSAHDLLGGYVPAGLPLEEAYALRAKDPDEYIRRAVESVVVHVEAMLQWQKKGAIVFDYGNNIRQQAFNAGVENAFDFPGFVPAFIRPMFCEGSGPFRWVALSGEPEDIYRTDEALIEAFPENESMIRWLRMAQEKVRFQGLPSRICWLSLRPAGQGRAHLQRTGEEGRGQGAHSHRQGSP